MYRIGLLAAIMNLVREEFCLPSTEARRPIKDGDKGLRGVGWGRGEGSEDLRQAPTRKTKNAVDRRQNNRMLIKAVSARHCAATSALRSCCPNCCARTESQLTTISVAPPLGNNRKKSNFQAELHLPTLDLFWANLRVLPPLDLAWTRK